MSHWAKAPMDRKQVLLFFPKLDDSISEDHPVRLYDEILARCDWSSWESQYVLVAGQPPIHPRVVASAILYGFGQGIRSSRVLERMCKNSLDYIWLVHGHHIDHTTFCKFRYRFSRELKDLFPADWSNGIAGQLLADTNFGSGENLAELQERHVEPYIPVRRNADRKENPAPRADPTQPVAEDDWPKLPRNVRTKKLDRCAFVYDQSADCYYCPMGNKLPFAGMQTKPRKNGSADYRIYRSQGCSDCALSGECLAGQSGRRTICRDKYEPLREKMDARPACVTGGARMNSSTGQKIYRQRKWLAETPFAIIKACMRLRQFLLRGIEKVRTEWLWACTTFNLAKLVRCIARLRVQTVAAAA